MTGDSGDIYMATRRSPGLKVKLLVGSSWVTDMEAVEGDLMII